MSFAAQNLRSSSSAGLSGTATTTSSIEGTARARWTMYHSIGLPRIGLSTLPGSRFEPIRACMIATVLIVKLAPDPFEWRATAEAHLPGRLATPVLLPHLARAQPVHLLPQVFQCARPRSLGASLPEASNAPPKTQHPFPRDQDGTPPSSLPTGVLPGR